MFRRSRFSIRPNVGTAGRTAATPQDASSVNQESSETPKDAIESSTTPAVTDNKPAVTPAEKPSASGDGNDQNGDGTSSSAAVQRRKRFSIKPKVAPGRPSTLARTPKSPVKAVSEPPVEVPASDHDKPTTSGQTATTAAPQGLQSPRRRRPSEDSKQPKVQPKSTLSPSDNSAPSAAPPAEDSLQQTHPPVDSGKQLEITSDSQVKEVPSRLPDKVPPSLPDREAIEISEKAKTLVSSKSGLSVSPPAFSLSRLLNDPSDLQRLAKARKLRELLREEMHKEKKSKRAKARVKEFTLDPAKMTMRDLIRYLPVSNPMTSSIEDPTPENETVVPPSPGRGESPERAQEPEVLPKIASPREEAEEEAAAEEDQEEALMVPQVKVAEDGSLIIDEESLTVEVQRAKGPNPAQERDPIFERGSTTTYSSFRKGTYSKPWSSEETDMFFLAISMVGTDFSMICQLFPHRARSEIKNKFKKEERENAWRIDKAFRERRKLDIEYFSKLLEKILEVQKNRKKLKSLAKKSPKKRKKKSRGKKAAKNLSDVEEEDEDEENDIPDLEGEEEEAEEGEKENEDLCNEGGTPASKPVKKRKRKNKQDASTKEPNGKKNKKGEKSSEQDEAYIPEDAEAALPEDRANSDISEKSENANTAKDAAIKPAKLSRGRAPKPLLPLGRKWGKKLPTPSTKAKDAVPDKGDESVGEGASEEKVNEDASPIRQGKKRKPAGDDISSEEEDVTAQPPRPTRYGRVPKPINPLNYPAKEDTQASESETTPASSAGSADSAAKPKPKCSAKRARSVKPQSAQESKKPKLVTLRASQTEYSDEENEKQGEEAEEEEVEEEEDQDPCSSKDSIAPVFVPVSLRSPQPVISEVEETMEELDILANMPDVLGISQDALCPDSSCELAQNETGTAEPCEHQLDLLVDVIDFLSSEHTEVSEEESYNEAAQTLLAIGNLAHVSQPAQSLTAILEHTTGTTSASGDETSQHEEEIASKPSAQEENITTPLMSATSGQEVTETPETVATVEPQITTADSGDMSTIETSEQMTGSDVDPTAIGPQLQSSPERPKKNSPQTKKGRLSKVKPKPNLSQASRSAQSKSQPEACHAVSSDFSQATETPLAAKDTHMIADCSQKSPMDEISCIEVRVREEPSTSQERSVGQVQSVVTASDQSTSIEVKSEPISEGTIRDSTRESTDEILMSHAGTAEISRNNLVTSDTAVTESQVTNIDSAPSQQSDHPSACVAPVDDLPVCQKEEGDDASTRQTRKSRFQKVKPKPNLAQTTTRTARSKPQATKDIEEKDASPTPSPKFCEKTKEVEAEPTCSTSPEKPSQNTGRASDLIPSLDLGSTLTPTEELSVTEEKKSDVGVFVQVEPGATASDQRTSENQNISEAQFEPRSEEATRDTRPTSESTEEKLVPPVGTTESSNNLLPCDTAAPGSKVGHGSITDSPSVQESGSHPAPSEVASTSPSRRGQKVKPKPNLAKTSRTVRSKPQTTEDPVKRTEPVEKPSSPTARPESTDNIMPGVEAQPTFSTTVTGKPSEIKSADTALDSVPPLELCSAHEPTEGLPSTGSQRTDGGSSEGPEQSLPQRRQRFPKVKPKPSLGHSTRTMLTKLRGNDSSEPPERRHMDISPNVTPEQQPVDNNDGKTEMNLTSTHGSLDTELLSSTRLGSAESEKSPDDTNEKGTCSDGVVIATSSVAGSQCVLPDSVLENKSNENPAVEEEFPDDKLETGPTSRLDPKQDMSTGATEVNTQSRDDPAAISDVQSSGDGSTVRSTLTTDTQSTSDPKGSNQQPHSEAQSQEAVAQSTTDTESESTESSKPSRKAPQTRRGRLVKPKPNLGRSSRPPQPHQVQDTKQAEEESAASSEGVDASVSHKPVSERPPDIQEPAGGALEQCSNQNPPSNDAESSSGTLTQVTEQHDSPPNVAASSLDYVTQAPDSYTQDASASSAGEAQSYSSFIFPDMLSEQTPSDPEEPFFILSLTEIPVCPPREVEDGVAEPPSYLPATDASKPPASSAPGEGLAAAGDGQDPAARVQGSIMENPVDPDESIAVQPSKLPETAENNDETECPPSKQRLRGTRRTAKPQVKPKTSSSKKQASRTLAAKEAESVPTQDSELPGPSVQPKASDDVVTGTPTGRGDHGDTEETLTGGKDHEKTRQTGSRSKKPRGLPSSLSETNTADPQSDSPPGKAASKGSKAKTARAARKQPTRAPEAPASHDVAPTPSPTRMPEEPQSPFSVTPQAQAEADIAQTFEHSQACPDPTSPCTAEVSGSRQSDDMDSSCIEEEPTSVSQYFLSDIFTEVEEG